MNLQKEFNNNNIEEFKRIIQDENEEFDKKFLDNMILRVVNSNPELISLLVQRGADLDKAIVELKATNNDVYILDVLNSSNRFSGRSNINYIIDNYIIREKFIEFNSSEEKENFLKRIITGEFGKTTLKDFIPLWKNGTYLDVLSNFNLVDYDYAIQIYDTIGKILKLAENSNHKFDEKIYSDVLEKTIISEIRGSGNIYTSKILFDYSLKHNININLDKKFILKSIRESIENIKDSHFTCSCCSGYDNEDDFKKGKREDLKELNKIYTEVESLLDKF